jgi:predicted enzyme related to lactoylglutathione lyase
MDGSFCTAVLFARDIDRAAGFYAQLVGWTTEEVAGTRSHRLLQSGGRIVASLHQIVQGNDIWVPHVSVSNVQSAVADARRLGATVEDTIEIPGLAKLATLHDPEGALFGMWEPAPHQGAQLTDEAGSLWWIEVLSNDVAGARDFYGRLFGWTSIDTSFEPFATYTVFRRGDVQEAGILPIGRDWDVSPRWNAIFAVSDCDATLERAKPLGGSTMFVHTVPKYGRIGSLSDSGGATFVIRGPVAAV